MPTDNKQADLLDPISLGTEVDRFYFPGSTSYGEMEARQLLDQSALLQEIRVTHPGQQALMATIDLELLAQI